VPNPNKLEARTTNADAYQAWPIEPPPPAPQYGTPRVTGSPHRFEGRTTNNDAYQAWPIEPPPTAPAGPSYVPNPNRLEAVTSYQQDYQAHALPPVAAPPSAPAYTPNPNRFEGSTTTADAYQPIELPVGVQALGVETMGAQFHTLIPAGTLPPAQGSAVFTTTHDNQTEVVIKALCMVGGKSVCLGSFELGGIQPKLMGIPQVLVQFDLDEKRILYVSAVDYGTHHRASLTVRPSNDNVLAGVEQLQLS
jgi:hypothetical protein